MIKLNPYQISCILKNMNLLFNCNDMVNNQLEQGGVVVSRWAHNSKVGGSKPLSATFLFCNT